jgi:hypothetical protein
MNVPVPVRSSPALLYECTVYFLDDCSNVLDLDPDSTAPADSDWESGSRQAGCPRKKGKNEDNSCLKSYLLEASPGC